MTQGKQTCKILKNIRRQIAEANNIELITSECQYQGDCPGTCPKCEAEIRYLEQQLACKRMAGRAITILGISAGIVAISPMTSCSSSLEIPIEKTNSKIASPEEENVLFGMVEQMPEFPGGQNALMEYLKKNTHYPKTNDRVSGRVLIQFTITKKGKITNIKVARSIHPLFDKEALRVIREMPQWKPGTQLGKAINTRYTIPITFGAK